MSDESKALAPTQPQVLSAPDPGREAYRIVQILKEWKDRAHLLTPMARTDFHTVAPFHRGDYRITYISTDKADGEIWEVRSGKWALSKIGLEKLDHLASIIWIPKQVDASGKVAGGTYVDYDMSNPLFARGNAEGMVREIDGKMRGPYTASRTVDLNDASPETVSILEGQNGAATLAQARRNICQLAETKAKNRVRRELLGLQSTYSLKELEKPFLVLTLVPDISAIVASDPALAQQYKARLLGITGELYGQLPADPLPVPVIDASTPQVLPPTDTRDLRVEPPPAAEDTRALQFKRINELYMRKLNAPRGSDRPPLESLADDQLDEVEEVLGKKPDHPEWIKQHPDSIL